MTMTLAILAAGMGTRFGASGAKQIQPLGPSGELLLDYSIHDALRAGFDHIVLIIRAEQEDDFRELVVNRWEARVKHRVTLVHQPPRDAGSGRVWGTAHAALCLEHTVEQPFAVINGDDFYGRTAIQSAAQFCHDVNPGAQEYATIAFPLDHTLRTGTAVNRAILHYDESYWLTDIREARIEPGADVHEAHTASGKVSVAPDALASMNMWVFTPAVFPQLASAFTVAQRELDKDVEFLLPDFARALVQSGAAHIRVIRDGGSPIGVTHPDDRESVRQVLAEAVRRGEYPSPI